MNNLFEKTSIIIVNYNGKEITSNCINSLVVSEFPEKNIILVDNASSDDSVHFLLKKYPEITIVQNNENKGYAAAINSGVSKANKKYLILSNNDVIYNKSSLLNLIKHISNEPETGAAGPQQIFPDKSWQRSGGILPYPKNRFKVVFLYSAVMDFIRKINYKFNLTNFNYQEEYIDGAVIAVRKAIFDKLDGFDSKNYFFYSEEADFCYRVTQSGLKNMIIPKATVIHLRGASSNDIKISNKAIEMLNNSKFIFLKKYFSDSEIKKYIKAVIINHKIYIFLWRTARKILPAKKTNIESKIEYFTDSIKIWKSKMDSLS
jgi:GT2 family glycosyltransferase